MNENYTDITLVIDRSGSMASIKEEMNGAIKSFIDEQKKIDQKCTVSAYQFDDQYECMCKNVPISVLDAPKISPRNMTALYDAVGKTINETGSRLRGMPEYDRPGRVIFVIITDGMENASREFTQERVFNMVKTQRDMFNWEFLFLGANIDSYNVGASLGLKKKNIIYYATNSVGVNNMAESLSNCVTRKRNMDYGSYCRTVKSGDSFSDQEQLQGETDANV